MQPDPSRLRDIPLFSDLTDEDLQTVASWLEVQDVSTGRRLTPEGASGYQLYLVDQGTADVKRDGALIGSLGPGDYFGEIAMMGDGRRMADVIATSPMTLFAMFGTSFREMEAGLPTVAARIRTTLQERLSSL